MPAGLCFVNDTQRLCKARVVHVCRQAWAAAVGKAVKGAGTGGTRSLLIRIY